MIYFRAFICLFLLTACQSFVAPDTQARLGFEHLEPIELHVHNLQIIESFTAFTDNKNFLLDDSPRATLRRLIQTKFLPTARAPNESFIRFHILEIKINQVERQSRYFFEGFIKVHIEAQNKTLGGKSTADIDLFAFQEAPLSITLVERDDILFMLNEALMDKFYKAFQKELLISFTYLQTRNY